MTAEDLFNTLKDLRDKEFEEFKWRLKQPDAPESYRTIKVCDLEKAKSRQDTVDLMVNRYGLQGAVDLTRRVLEKMAKKNLVSSLPGSNSGPEAPTLNLPPPRNTEPFDQNAVMSSPHPLSVTHMRQTGCDERRIILLGRTWSGKSSSGNTILGRNVFVCERSEVTQTMECKNMRDMVGGRMVAVTDTPGLFDTRYPLEYMLSSIKMCIGMSSPGPHAFLLVLQLGRFTDEEKKTVKMIQDIFGEDADKYTLVLFTHGDRLRRKTFEELVSKTKDLQRIIQKYYGRYHVFNNYTDDPSQVSELLEKIDNMVKSNGALPYYTTEMFLNAEKAREEEKKRILKEELEEIKARAEAEAAARNNVPPINPCVIS